MPSSTQRTRSAPSLRRRLGAVLATVVASSALVAVGTPAEAAVTALTHSCTNGINEPATVSIDTNAPATMYVNEQRDISATTNLTWPGQTTYNMMLAWGAGWVEGSGVFKVNVGSTPATFSTPFTRVNVDAGWMINGSDSDPIPLNSSSSSTVRVTAPATPGPLAITESKSSGKSLDAAITFHRNSWIFGNFNHAPRCVHGATPDPTIDTITIRSRSRVTDLAFTPASVQQNNTATASARVAVDGGTPNGTVTFVNEGTGDDLASVAVSAATTSTTVTAPLPVLPVGVHTITARFTPSNATLYDASVSAARTFEVKAARATTTSLTLTPSEIAPAGSSVATATVQPATGSGTPSGSVRFTYNGTDTLVAVGPGGTASQTISGLAVGDYPVRATFVPTDANSWTTSQSASTLLTVIKRAAASTTNLTFTKNPALTTDTVGAIATVSIAGGAAAAGTVSFTITGGPDGSVFETPPAVPVGADGTANLDLSDLVAGPYEVLAEFTPTDSAEQTRSSSSATVFTVSEPQVEPAVDTSTSLALDKTAVFAGEVVTATATVTADSGPGQPQGSVFFSVDGLETSRQLINGTVSLPLAGLALGTHSVTARFVPADAALFNASGPTSAQLITVTKRPAVATTTSLLIDPETITEDDDATATASVTAPSGTLAGTIDFAVTVDGDTTTQTRPYRADGTTLVLSGLAPGTYSVRATFVPASSDDFIGSQSDVETLSVTAAPPSQTTTSLSLSRTRATTLESVSATARVAAGRGVADGTVLFSYGVTSITAPLDADGAATIDLAGLAVGANEINATFQPSAGGRFLTSSAAPKTVTVTQAADAATVTSVTLSEVTTTVNEPVTAEVGVAGTGGTPTGTVQLTFQGRTGVVTTLVDGAATVEVPAKGDGTYDVGAGPVVAAYTPANGSSTAVSQGSQTLTVTAAAGAQHTTTTLSLDRSSIIVGGTATATARVALAGSPSGSIVFGYRGFETTVPLTADSASLELAGVTAGNHPVSARFVPDTGALAPSSAQDVTLSVSPVTAAPSATVLTLSDSSIAFGESVTATADVTSSGAIAGDVTFSVAGQAFTSEVDPSTGKATAVLSGLAVGDHGVTATFAPANASTHQGSTSEVAQLEVVATSAVNLSLSAGTVVQGGTVSAIAAVTTLGGPSAGVVTFRVGGRDVTAPVANGSATAALTGLAPGDYDVVASFAPTQAGMKPSSSTARALRVTAAPTVDPPTPPAAGGEPAAKATSLKLLASRPSSAYGQPTTVVATAPAGVDGFVQFTVGGFSQDVPVQSGTATLTVPRTLPVAVHTVNATLVPTASGSYTPSTASTSLTIVKDSVVTKFAKRWTPATKTLQVRARMIGTFATPAVGKVTFTLHQKGTTKKKVVKVSRATATIDANGVAEVKLPTKGRLGTFRVTVTYAGSTTLLASSLQKNLKIR